MSEKDPDKPWLYPIGNRLDPHDRLVTLLTQVVPDYEQNGQKISDITSEEMVFGLSVSFEGQYMNDVTSELSNRVNTGDNAQGIDSQHMEDVIFEPLTITNS